MKKYIKASRDIIKYRTNFNLTNPIDPNGALKARRYLDRDYMIEYLQDDVVDMPNNLSDACIDIKWVLEDLDSGYIELKANRELTPDELSRISSWVSGQNSDGLGEGFEQQDFALMYTDPDGNDYYGFDGYKDAERYGYYEDDLEETISSFDWETNDYEFYRVS